LVLLEKEIRSLGKKGRKGKKKNQAGKLQSGYMSNEKNTHEQAEAAYRKPHPPISKKTTTR
jgi:hypothetical protein